MLCISWPWLIAIVIGGWLVLNLVMLGLFLLDSKLRYPHP
jgi:hypothetical protein